VESALPTDFFFFVAFLVVFLALGCFTPHVIILPPPFPFYIDLFIAFNLLFVKKFLIVTAPIQGLKIYFSEEANLISPLTGLNNAIKMDHHLFPKGGMHYLLEMKRNQKMISI
jgi:hypothetical protein